MGHSQRLQDSPFQLVPKGIVSDLLDQHAQEDVVGIGVVKLPVGFCASSLIRNIRRPRCLPSCLDRRNGVHPSPRLIMYEGDFTGSNCEYLHIEFVSVGNSPESISSLTPTIS